MAESKGFFGVLPYAFASLRSLTTDFQTVHRTVFIGKADRPCSNPLLSYQQKNKGYSKCYTLYFLAESKGLGSLRSPKSLLRKQSYYRLLLTRLRLAKDCKGSNPTNNSQKNNGTVLHTIPLFLGGEQGIRTLETVLAVYTISNRAPSTSSDNSPCYLRYYIRLFEKNQV